jgi:saccharopine dehydrogenase-like NADP-dependent oxidoreductase
MVSAGVLPDKGFLRQESVSLDKFFETRNGARYQEHGRRT